jgi:protein O-GlcNAc transferase
MPSLQPTVQDSEVKRAFELHQSGRLDEAEALYRAALVRAPLDFNALHLLGALCAQKGRMGEALALFEQAVKVPLDRPEAFYNCGILLMKLNRPEEALASFERALDLQPDYPEAFFNRGMLLGAMSRLEEALESLDRVVQLQPNHADALFNRGVALEKLHRLEEALASFDRVVQLQPDYVSALYGSGVVLEKMNRPDEALDRYGLVLKLRPNHADALLKRGILLGEKGRLDEALASFDHAVRLRPESADTFYNHGVALERMNRWGEAAASYDRALQLQPDHAGALLSRGIVLRELNRLTESLDSLGRLLRLEPEHADGLNAHADVLRRLKRFEDAEHSLQRLLAVSPSRAYAQGQLLNIRLDACDWRDSAELSSQIEAGIERGERQNDPWRHSIYSRSAASQLHCAQIFAVDRCSTTAPPQAIGQRVGHDRIRLAWLSPDFRQHPIGQLTVELFELHDRSRFETFGISFGQDDQSPIRQRIRNAFEHFVAVESWSDSAIVQWMGEQEIDIAVDLAGYTAGCRPNIFAARGAPLQVNYLGYPGTMGAPFADYILADPQIIPPRNDLFYSEKVVRLPDAYQANDRTRAITAATPTRGELDLPQDGFVFCCFNNNFKIMPDIFDVWMRLLRDIEGSVLWLLQDNQSAADNLRREAERRGVAPSRLVFAPRRSMNEHLARHRAADLFVDTNPYNAHTTASDALWAGLPLVTLSGETFASRVAGSLLKAIGLPELVTYGIEDYELLIRRLATSPPTLAELRTRLARNRLVQPLFNTDLFRRNVEAAFATMYDRHRRGLAPMSFDVPRNADTP